MISSGGSTFLGVVFMCVYEVVRAIMSAFVCMHVSYIIYNPISGGWIWGEDNKSTSTVTFRG